MGKRISIDAAMKTATEKPAQDAPEEPKAQRVNIDDIKMTPVPEDVGDILEADVTDEPFEGVEEAGSDILETLETPMEAMEAGVGALMETEGDLGDKMKAAWEAAKAQFGDDPPEVLDTSDLIAQNMINQGTPPRVAVKNSEIIGPFIAAGLDPLNFLDMGALKLGRVAVKQGAKLPKVVTEGIKKVKGQLDDVGQALDYAEDVSTPRQAQDNIRRLSGEDLDLRGAPDPRLERSIKPSKGDRFLSAMSGVAAEKVARARNRSIETISRARTKDELVDFIGGHVRDIETERRSAKEAFDSAKAAYNEARKSAQRRVTNADLPAGYEAKVVDSMKALKEKISIASQEAMNILEETKKDINFLPVQEEIANDLANMQFRGEAPPPGTARRATYDQLERIGEFFTGVYEDGTLDPMEAKQVIRMIDEETDAAYEAIKAGKFIPAGQRNLIKYRAMIDEQLKEIDEYKEAMGPLAEGVKALSDASKIFSGDRQIRSRAKGLTAKERQTIQNLSRMSGIDLIAEIDEFEKIRSFKGNIDEVPDVNPLWQAMKQARMNFERSDAAYKAVNQLMADNSVKGAMDGIISGRIGTNSKKIKALDALSDMINSESGSPEAIDLVMEIYDSGLNDLLKMRSFNSLGSGRVSVGGIVGSPFIIDNLLAGDKGSAVAVAMLAGGIPMAMDVFGPAVVRRIVDLQTGKALPKVAIRTATKGVKGLANLLGNPLAKYNIAPGVIQQVVDPASELRQNGSLILTADDPRLAELKALTLDSDMALNEKAKILNAVKKGYIEINYEKLDAAKKDIKRDKIDLDAVNKALRKIKP